MFFTILFYSPLSSLYELLSILQNPLSRRVLHSAFPSLPSLCESLFHSPTTLWML